MSVIPHGHHRPHGPGARRRHPVPGLRRGPARQGHGRARRVPPRRAQRRPDGARHHGPAARRTCWAALDPGRDRVRVAEAPASSSTPRSSQRDLPLLQGSILVLAMFFVVLNLLVDVMRTALDPRIERALSRSPMMTRSRHRGLASPSTAACSLAEDVSHGPEVPPLRPVGGASGAMSATGSCATPSPWARGAVILIVVLIAILSPWITPMDPYKGSMLRRLKHVGDATYWLGLGRARPRHDQPADAGLAAVAVHRRHPGADRLRDRLRDRGSSPATSAAGPTRS